MPEAHDKLIILTGAPGSGKTTLMKQLRSQGVPCIDEPARFILAEQRATGGAGTPERNPQLFSELLLSRSIKNYQAAKQLDSTVIFDRGIADCIAYASLFNLATESFEKAAMQYPFNPTAFVLTPWREIYVTDDERTMTFPQTVAFHEHIVSAYQRLGYHLVEIPQETVEARARFLLSGLRRN